MGRGLTFLAGLLVAALSSGVAAAEEVAPKRLPEPPVEPARVALLAKHLSDVSALAAIEPYVPAMAGTACAVGTVALAAADTNEMHLSRTAMLLPTTLCAAASFGSYLLPREYQGRIAQFSVLTSLATLLSASVLTAPDTSSALQVSMLGLTGGSVALGTLGLIDAALERPVTWTTLTNDADELRVRGASMSRADVQRIEGDLRRHAVRPIPRWAYGLTLLVSGAVSMSPALAPSTAREDRVGALAIGSANVLVGGLSFAFALATDNQYERYDKERLKLRLSPVGPRGAAGLWASVTF